MLGAQGLRFGGAGAWSALTRTVDVPAMTAFTFMAWVRFYTLASTNGRSNVVFVIGGASGKYVLYQVNTNNAIATWNGAAFLSGTVMGSTQRWYHLCCTVAGTSGSNFLAYLDGVLAITGTARNNGTPDKVRFGNDYNNNSNWATAETAGVKIWNRVLGKAEINAEMRALEPFSTQGLYCALATAWDERRFGPAPRGAVGPFADTSGRFYDFSMSGAVVPSCGPPVRSRFDVPLVTVTGAVITAAALEAAVAGSAAATGALTTDITMAGAVGGSAAASGALTTEVTLAAAVTGSAAVSGALTTEVLLAADVSGAATVVGGLTTVVTMAAAVGGAATVTGVLTTEVLLAAAVSGAAVTAGGLTTTVLLAGGVSGSGTVSAAFTTTLLLGGAAAGSGSAAGALTVPILFVAAVTGTASTSAVFTTDATLLAGAAGGQATVTGVLTAPGQVLYVVVRSGARYTVTATSGARYDAVGTIAARYAVTAAGAPRYGAVHQSGPRYETA